MKTLLQCLSNPRQVCHSAWNQARTKMRRFLLDLRHKLAGQTIWTQHQGFWLPYHGDGDLQEIYYQIGGGMWIAELKEKLTDWLHEGDVVVDVGANMGFTALVFSSLVGSSGRVVAFEPSPWIYPRLVDVIRKNGLEHQVECLNLGCGTSAKTETLMVPVSSGNATIKRAGETMSGPVHDMEIHIDTLDPALLHPTTRHDFLKIDTEGFEDQVLAGGTETIRRFQPVIYIELSQEYGESSERAINWLQNNGYSFEKLPNLEEAHNGDNFIAYPANRKLPD